MLRGIFFYWHVGLALLCLVVLLYAGATAPHGDEPIFAFGGMCLFAGMALAIRARSRWVLLPGTLLVLISLVATIAFAAAFVWPERDQNVALAFSLGLAAFEVAAIVSTLTAKRTRT